MKTYLQIVSIFFTIYYKVCADFVIIECDKVTANFSCTINGSTIEGNQYKIKISPKISHLYLNGFENLQNDQFVDQLKIIDVNVINSSLQMVLKSKSTKDEIINFSVVNSNVSLAARSFISIQMLKNLYFRNVKFDNVDSEAFFGVPDMISIEFTNVKITNELIVAFKSLLGVKLICSRCELNDEKFSSILKALRFSQSISVMSNNITTLKCNEIANFDLVKLSMRDNQLSKTLSTCKVSNVDFSVNHIQMLIIQSGTKILDASNNLISSIKCEGSLDTVSIYLNDNLLNDLSCITTISTLEELCIDSNNFTYFKANSFDKLTKLKYISVINNPIRYYRPNVFTIRGKSTLTRINIDQFDFGYENLKRFYPQLTEVFHNKFNKSCEIYFNILETLKSQNINFYLFEPVNCKIDI